MVVPADSAFTMPVPKPIVATPGSLLYQPPPPTSVRVVERPAQICDVPVIGDGGGLTVTVFVARHPVGKV